MIYIDGSLDAAAAASGVVNNNSYEVRIGDNSQQQGRYFHGNIDEVAIYRTALSAEKVLNHYAANAGAVIKSRFNLDYPPLAAIEFNGQLGMNGGVALAASGAAKLGGFQFNNLSANFLRAPGGSATAMMAGDVSAGHLGTGVAEGLRMRGALSLDGNVMLELKSPGISVLGFALEDANFTLNGSSAADLALSGSGKLAFPLLPKLPLSGTISPNGLADLKTPLMRAESLIGYPFKNVQLKLAKSQFQLGGPLDVSGEINLPGVNFNNPVQLRGAVFANEALEIRKTLSSFSLQGFPISKGTFWLNTTEGKLRASVDLNVPNLSRTTLAGSFGTDGTFDLNVNGAMSAGIFNGSGLLSLNNTRLYTSGQFNISAAGIEFGKDFDFSGTIDALGNYRLKGTDTLSFGGITSSLQMELRPGEAASTGAINIPFGGLNASASVRIDSGGISISGSRQDNSGWIAFGPGLWGRVEWKAAVSCNSTGAISAWLAGEAGWYQEGPLNPRPGDLSGVPSSQKKSLGANGGGLNVNSDGKIRIDIGKGQWDFDLW
jgi:hypothetical protein